MQLQVAVQVMNSQWANYQDAINKNRRNRMHNPSLEGLYQTLTKQQEIIYRQREKVNFLKSKLGLRESFLKQKTVTSPLLESFSDSMISMSLADQIERENSKLTSEKLRHLRGILSERPVVTIKPQRPERLGVNSEIIREKRLQALKAMKKPVASPAKAPAQAAVQPPAQPQQKIVQKPQQKVVQQFIQSKAEERPTTGFGIELSQGGQASFGTLNPSEPLKLSFAGFGVSASPNGQAMFGVSKPDEPAKPSFAGFAPTVPQATSFGLNLSSKPSFGISSAPLVLGVEKRKEEASSAASSNQAPRLFLNPVAVKANSEGNKTPSTISNTNVAVSATFSIPLANKVTPIAKVEQPKVVEKAQEKTKPLGSNENASFTFKIPEKKDESASVTIKAPSGTPSFSSLLTGAGNDNAKTFSFSSGSTASPFEAGSKATELTKSSSVPTTSVPSVFSGFGSATTTAGPFQSGSLFGSTTPSFGGFGSGFSGFGSDNSKSTSFSLNLSSSSDSLKPTASGGAFSFASLPSTIASAVGEDKPPADSGTLTSSKSSTASSFSFGSTFSQTTAINKPESVEAAVSSPQPSTFEGLSSGLLTPRTSPDESKVTSSSSTPVTSSSAKTDNQVLQGLQICSPEVSKPVTQSPPANIFATSGSLGSAAKADSSSLFSSNAFGSAFGQTSTLAPSFGSTTSPIQVTAALATPTPTTTSQTSIFGTQNTPTTATPSPSIFGSLSLGSSEANKPSSTSPPSGLFSSLVKPDQSVFGSSTTTTSPAISSFGGAFSGSTAPTTNIFGAPSAPAPVSPSTNIFGGTAATNQASSGTIFGSSQTATTPASAFGSAPKAQGSIFGQSATASATGGSIFSQSSFSSSPSTNVFGGSSQTASPFGSTNVFGSATGTQQASTGSIFGGQSSFGSQPSTGSVFGGGATGSSPFGSSSIFGGGATFGNSFSGVGQTGFGSAASSTSPFNQQAPTFGGGATFGSPKSNIFGQQSSTGQGNNLFEQLGSQQSGSGNLFGGLVQNTQPAQPPPVSQPPGQPGFQGSAFSSWR